MRTFHQLSLRSCHRGYQCQEIQEHVQNRHRIQSDLRGHFQDLQSIRNYAETLLSLAITESDFLTVPPSLIAVASLITAMSSLNQKPSHNEPLVANFLQNLFDLTGLNLQEVAAVINNLEVIVRARINFDNQCTNYNTPIYILFSSN